MAAATAGVYALIGTREFDAAEELIKRFISEDSECSEDNDIMFTAASRFYEVTGNKKEKKRIDKEIKKYEKYLEEYFNDMGEDEEEWPFG